MVSLNLIVKKILPSSVKLIFQRHEKNYEVKQKSAETFWLQPQITLDCWEAGVDLGVMVASGKSSSSSSSTKQNLLKD